MKMLLKCNTGIIERCVFKYDKSIIYRCAWFLLRILVCCYNRYKYNNNFQVQYIKVVIKPENNTNITSLFAKLELGWLGTDDEWIIVNSINYSIMNV